MFSLSQEASQRESLVFRGSPARKGPAGERASRGCGLRQGWEACEERLWELAWQRHQGEGCCSKSGVPARLEVMSGFGLLLQLPLGQRRQMVGSPQGWLISWLQEPRWGGREDSELTWGSVKGHAAAV